MLQVEPARIPRLHTHTHTRQCIEVTTRLVFVVDFLRLVVFGLRVYQIHVFGIRVKCKNPLRSFREIFSTFSFKVFCTEK